MRAREGMSDKEVGAVCCVSCNVSLEIPSFLSIENSFNSLFIMSYFSMNIVDILSRTHSIENTYVVWCVLAVHICSLVRRVL